MRIHVADKSDPRGIIATRGRQWTHKPRKRLSTVLGKPAANTEPSIGLQSTAPRAATPHPGYAVASEWLKVVVPQITFCAPDSNLWDECHPMSPGIGGARAGPPSPPHTAAKPAAHAHLHTPHARALHTPHTKERGKVRLKLGCVRGEATRCRQRVRFISAFPSSRTGRSLAFHGCSCPFRN